MQVAPAWLLRHSPNVLLIPGTSSVAHLRENMRAEAWVLDDVHMRALDDVTRLLG